MFYYFLFHFCYLNIFSFFLLKRMCWRNWHWCSHESLSNNWRTSRRKSRGNTQCIHVFIEDKIKILFTVSITCCFQHS